MGQLVGTLLCPSYHVGVYVYVFPDGQQVHIFNQTDRLIKVIIYDETPDDFSIPGWDLL